MWAQDRMESARYYCALKCTVSSNYVYSYRAVNTSHLMLYSEIIAVCSQIHTKHTNTLCGQNVELLNVKAGVT